MEDHGADTRVKSLAASRSKSHRPPCLRPHAEASIPFRSIHRARGMPPDAVSPAGVGIFLHSTTSIFFICHWLIYE
jgi:hypothetical protein